MTGVLFIVNIPQKQHEENLKNNKKTSKTLFENEEATLKSTKNYDSLKTADTISKFKSIDRLHKGLFKSKSETAINLGIENKSEAKWREIKHAMQPRRCKVKISRPIDALSFKWDTPLETILSEIVVRLDIKNATWNPTQDGTFWQVIFSVDSDPLCEELLQVLRLCDIGSRHQSSVSVIPCSLHYSHDCGNKEQNNNEEWKSNPNTVWSRFSSSVRSRNNLDQILQEVRSDSALTFDWIFLLVVAAFVAAVGLVENSTVILVASMLISPLMGPITAGTLGTAIHDRSLQQIGVMHEALGLFLSLVIGFIFGLLICAVDEQYGVGEWPTYEMMSRCDLRSLWIGVLIAIPSGAAVALAVLSEYTASFVGVAISASLLPPAVNAGLFWALALVHLIYVDDTTRWTSMGNTSLFSSNQATELAVMGTVSLCLTLVNILCIFFAGVAVYKVKAVNPSRRKDIPWLRKGNNILRSLTKSDFKENPSNLWENYTNLMKDPVMNNATENKSPVQSDTVTFRRHKIIPRTKAVNIEELYKTDGKNTVNSVQSSDEQLEKCDTDSGNDSQSLEADSLTSTPKCLNHTAYQSLEGFGTLYTQATIEPSLNYTINPSRGIVLDKRSFHV